MRVVIGIILLVYGWYSYTHPIKKHNKGPERKQALPEWLPLLEKFGGVLLMIVGGLLILVSFMLQ